MLVNFNVAVPEHWDRGMGDYAKVVLRRNDSEYREVAMNFCGTIGNIKADIIEVCMHAIVVCFQYSCSYWDECSS